MATLSSIRSAAIEDTGFSSGLDSAQVTAIAGEVGLSVYSTLDDLPTTGLTSGDQAFVSSTNRFYISNGSGWYNVALVNATPTLVVSPTGTVALAIDGSTPTVITLTATDSDNADASLTYSVESDGSFAGLGTISQDSSVFTITPLSEDSATTETSTLTFKASDGISFGSGTTTFTLTFITTIENSNYTTLLLKNEETTDNQVDASTNNHTITENGNVTSTAFAPYNPGGYSVAFAGSDDYIGFDNGYIATNGTWWNSSGFTLELWFYKTVSTGTTGTVFDNRQSPTNGFLLTNKNTGWDMYLNGGYLFQSVGTEKVGQWVHLALVASGTTVTLYEDGTSIYTTGSAPNTSSYAYFGRSQNTVGAVQYTPRGTNVDWPGYMYDIRISSGSRYTTAFTPSETPHENDSNTILLACSSPMLKDKSSNNHEITVFGDGISTARFTPHDHDPYTKADHGGSVYFDGTSDYLSFTMTSDFSLTGDFTLECWFKPNSITVDTQHPNLIILGTYQLYLNSSTNFVGVSPDGLSITLQSNAQTIKPNLWYHAAVVRSGTSEALFLNGVRVDTNTASTNYGASSGTSYIGSYNGTGGDYNGYITDLRLVNGTAVYDPSQTTVTIPTAPLTAITNTKLLTCTNKNDIWDAGSGNRLTKAGNVTGGANSGTLKFGKTAVYFDGTGDYLNTNSNDLLALGTGDFTVECWVNKSDTNHRGIFQIGSDASGLDTNYTVTLGFGWGNSTAWQIYAGGSATNGSTFSLSTDTWYHAAVVRSSGTTKLYIDGTEEISISDSQNYAGTYMAIGGYYSTTYLHNGYIQDLRVTKGLARYTANFTPPTTEFEA